MRYKNEVLHDFSGLIADHLHQRRNSETGAPIRALGLCYPTKHPDHGEGHVSCGLPQEGFPTKSENVGLGVK